MKTLFIVAEMQEAEHLIKHYNMRKIEYGRAGGNGLCFIDLWKDWTSDLTLIVTGAGVNNVIASLSKAAYLGILDAYTNIVNVGYAGAKGIDIGSVICVKACHCLEFPTKANTAIENCVELSNEGVDCYTSFDFVEDPLDIICGQALFDMELAYIARFTYKSLYSIKIVSDNLEYNGFKEFNGEEAWKEAINKIEERRQINVSRYITT